MTDFSLVANRRHFPTAIPLSVRKRRAAKIAGALLPVALALGLAASVASADEIAPESTGLPFARQLAVLTDQGIPSEDAMQALDLQAKVAETNLIGKLQTAQGSAYAGVWAEPRTAQFYVGVTSPASRRTAERLIAETGLAAQVRLASVGSTSMQLLAAQERWSRKLARTLAPRQAETGIQPQYNAVLVTLASSVPAARRRALERDASVAEVNVVVTVAAVCR